MHKNILIIGAGPTGLAAALFLSERGYKPYIIEKRPSRSPFSKAFGVNSRSLDLLTSSGVAQRFIDNGRKLERLVLRRRGEEILTLKLNEVDHKYPFMLVQSQSDSERILEEALNERDIYVERGVECVSVGVKNESACVEVVKNEQHQTLTSDCVLGADGPGSFVRRSLNISFEGETYDETWSLYDVELTTSLPQNEASIFLHDEGGIFVVRHDKNIWRILGNVPDMLHQLPSGTKAGKVYWHSDFDISNRVADAFAKPPYYIAGDAAHIHSGIGARGMNLGIEDAYVFANLYDTKQLDRYHGVRSPVIHKVVDQIKVAMGPPRPTTLPGKMVRTFPWVVSAISPLVKKPVQRWVLGLDHDVKL